MKEKIKDTKAQTAEQRRQQIKELIYTIEIRIREMEPTSFVRQHPIRFKKPEMYSSYCLALRWVLKELKKMV